MQVRSRTRAPRIAALGLGLVLAAALALAGCGQKPQPGEQASGQTGQEPAGQSSGGQSGGEMEQEPDVVWTITALDFQFKTEPEALAARKGQLVKIVFKNKGSVEHDFSVADLDAMAMGEAVAHVGHEETPPVHVVAAAGETAEVLFMPQETGTFTAICTVPGHEQLGMKLELSITD